MILTIRNEYGSACVDTQGAQWVSFKDAQGLEHLWQGDAAYWSGQAPVLFPIVGALRNGRAHIKDGEYEMKQHGIARHLAFEVTEQKEDSVTLTLRSTEETKKQYPYDFALHMTYRFEGPRMVTEFKVENTGDEVMPFALGGHPAFNCPMVEGETFENYVVEFEKPETARCPAIEGALINFNHRTTVLEYETTIPMRHELFHTDALIFDTPRSRVVRLKSLKTGHGVEMDFDDFCYLGVWSAKNDAPFVALEPWAGCATGTDEDDEFLHKRALTLLKPGKAATFAFGVKAL